MIVADTHAVLWLTEDPAQLSAPALTALAEGRRAGRLLIADITLREIAMQVSRGRIDLPRTLADYLSFVESMFAVVPIDGAIAERSTGFSTAYPRDPADRLIGATAIVHKARLVTADEKIRASGEVDCVW